MSLRHRIATLPWPFVLLLLVAAGLAGGALARFVFGSLEGSPVWPAGWAVIAGVSAVAGVGVVLRRRRLRAEGRFEASVAAGQAIWTGRLPADPAARAEVARMIPGQRAMLPLFRWVAPVLFGLVAVGSVLSALDDRPRQWIAAAVFGALVGAYPVYARRLARRLDGLEQALRPPPR